MHDWYDWLKDIGLPTLTGVGSVVVGAVAIVVARQSHKLAVQVRLDESKRDRGAARERYRDQLFRTVEPTVTAMLDHRAEMLSSRRVGTADERNLLSNAIARLRLVLAVVSEHDRPVIDAVVRCYRKASDHTDWRIGAAVAGGLSVVLPSLLTDDHDVARLVADAEKLMPEAIAAAEEADKYDDADDY
ncbi:hypothetical protein J2X60_002992 [Curtobacterium sp. 320]|uniref:hypothetical protein n=1 Tax=Curtobacterium sp. 320 TaxID=2817749 RepID=UPI00285F2844|nr:hypothetical protein [Curtobacterium sp. 320]MDR6574333.1 hypothetical protein [Curtobacterium sp. 320]